MNATERSTWSDSKNLQKTEEQKGLMGFTNRIWHFLVEIKKCGLP